ncbi:MAG: hypothetical protein ACRCZB_03595, partial [Bacteroidales bacterium]
MIDTKNIAKSDTQEKAVLIGLITEQQSDVLAQEYLNELQFLAETAHLNTLKQFTQRMHSP